MRTTRLFLFFFLNKAISLFFLIVLFLRRHFAGEFPLSADYLTAFFHKKEMGYNQIQCLSDDNSDSFIHVMYVCNVMFFIQYDGGINLLNSENISHEEVKLIMKNK